MFAEAGRVHLESFLYASGKRVYTDFTMQYPPLWTWFTGKAMAWWGVRFEVYQAVYSLFSVLFCVLYYRLCRMFLSRVFAVVVFSLVFCVANTALSWFHLFSMKSPTPHLLPGLVGVLLLLYGALQRLVWTGNGLGWNGCLIALGAWISFLSKQESILCAAGILLGMLVLRRKHVKELLGDGVCMAVAVLPVCGVYAWLAYTVGWREWLFAWRGYGLGGFSWWWLSRWGVAGACCGLAVMVCLRGCAAGVWMLPWQKKKRWFSIGVSVSALFGYGLLHVFAHHSEGGLPWHTVVVRELFSHQWLSWGGLISACGMLFARKTMCLEPQKILLVWAACCASLRMLLEYFPFTVFFIPSAFAVPLLFLTAVVCAMHAYKGCVTVFPNIFYERRFALFLACYGFVFFGIPCALQWGLRHRYLPLKTRAGVVYLPASRYAEDAKLYRMLENHTGVGDTLYASEGFLNMALHLPSPFYATQRGMHKTTLDRVLKDKAVLHTPQAPRYAAILHDNPDVDILPGRSGPLDPVYVHSKKNYNELPFIEDIRERYVLEYRDERFGLYRRQGL